MCPWSQWTRSGGPDRYQFVIIVISNREADRFQSARSDATSMWAERRTSRWDSRGPTPGTPRLSRRRARNDLGSTDAVFVNHARPITQAAARRAADRAGTNAGAADRPQVAEDLPARSRAHWGFFFLSVSSGEEAAGVSAFASGAADGAGRATGSCVCASGSTRGPLRPQAASPVHNSRVIRLRSMSALYCPRVRRRSQRC